MVLARLFAFTVCFIVANCYMNKMLFRRQSFDYAVVGNPEFESCSSRNFSKSLKSNLNIFKCQPRDAIVHLHSEENNIEVMIPNKVVVKRCYESGCYGMNSCLPTKTKLVKVAVRLNYRVGSDQKCSWVNVVEHTECKCGCKVTKDNCEQQNKTFFPRECLCKCTNENAKRECRKQENMFWDEDSCSCMCQTSFMECSTGTVWVPKYCRCMQVMMSEEDQENDKLIYNFR